MQKKLITLLILGMFIMSGLGVYGAQNQMSEEKETIDTLTLDFTQPVYREKEEYISVDISETSTYLMQAGQPMVPKSTNHIELPFGVTNVLVEVTPYNIAEYPISKEIIPAPVPIPLTDNPINKNAFSSKPSKDMSVYDANKFFPDDWYSYSVGCGLNENMERVTHLSINTYPVRYNPVQEVIQTPESVSIKISYETPDTNVSAANDAYDLVVIAPDEFSSELQRLVTHKNNMGLDTIFKSTEDIYSEFSGVDKPEKIKYFIKDAIESWGITYVLLVGGLKSELYGKAKDTENYGSKDWHLPVRYSNLRTSESGYITDLYYADIYKEGGEFDDWDSNDDGTFANWGFFGKDKLDFYPDVALGRLACRNIDEVTTVVNKIITYEETKADPAWFEKIIGITGDGFLDQETLDFEWNTNGLPTGSYTIYGQSNNDEAEFGPIDEITVTIDKSKETVLTFNHDDHLQIVNFPNYPHPPIAEISTVSNGDILGNTDFSFVPPDDVAYCNNGWANMKYRNGVLTINGKSYDPKLYGNITDIHIWIENSGGEVVFDDWRYNLTHIAEGDWVVGEKVSLGRGGALHYMPEEYEKPMLSSSNGKWTGMDDVIDAIDEGAGFLIISGHGSPHTWGNQYPGIPGNRQNAHVEGISVSQLKLFPPFKTADPAFPIDSLSNGEKLPVIVIGGCHNSQFNVSGIPSLLHLLYYMGLMKNNHMNTYGNYCPESFSWRFVRAADGGAIASIGNTGYGFGYLGEAVVLGMDGWISTEFFRQCGVEGHEILGDAYSQTLTTYINEIGVKDDGDAQTVQQWVLLGDPSLKLGGYE